MAIDDVAVGMAVKNSILFALLVLIAHYALRNVLNSNSIDDRSSISSLSSSRIAENGSVSSDSSPLSRTKSVTFALDKNVEIEPPAPSADRLSPKGDPLYDYVFGGDGGSSGSSGSSGSISVSATAKGSSSSSSGSSKGKADPAGDHRGCMVVGQYSDENELCGGKLFDTGTLQGHDGVFSNSFSAWA